MTENLAGEPLPFLLVRPSDPYAIVNIKAWVFPTQELKATTISDNIQGESLI